MLRNILRLITLSIPSIIFIYSCSIDSKPKEETIKNEIILNSKIDNWLNNNKRKHFKIDSSEFEVYAWKTLWQLRFEQTVSFKSQIEKVKKILSVISKQTDISELGKITIMPINRELLADIAQVSEIQTDLRRAKYENGIVNSMGIVSEFASNSKYFKEFTNLFQPYKLEPYDYYIDKWICNKNIDKRLSHI